MTIRQVKDPAHVITMGVIEEGTVRWAFRCIHSPDDETWAVRNPDGTLWDSENPMAHGCWLYSWWEGLGQELIDARVTPPITLAVRPNAEWDYEDGGSLEWDWIST